MGCVTTTHQPKPPPSSPPFMHACMHGSSYSYVRHVLMHAREPNEPLFATVMTMPDGGLVDRAP
jgi:hypothetical protein